MRAWPHVSRDGAASSHARAARALPPQAYAKLHRSYAAIEGGSLTAALVDLSGGYAEQIDLTSALAREELASGRLWRRLMRYQKLGASGVRAGGRCRGRGGRTRGA